MLLKRFLELLRSDMVAYLSLKHLKTTAHQSLGSENPSSLVVSFFRSHF